jgi:HEAT repeat protein
MGAKAPPGYGRNRQTARGNFLLWVAVVVANMVGIGIAVFVAAKMRAIPEEAWMEQALRFTYYASILAIAIVDAFLVDELVFGGTFRLTQLQGRTTATLDKNASQRQVAATLHGSPMAFPVVVVLCGMLTYMLFNLINRDFSGYDSAVGVYVSDLRGNDPEGRETRLSAVDSLSSRVRPEVRPVLMDTLQREDPELAGWAAWAIGRLHQPQTVDKRRPFDLRPFVIKELVKAQRRQSPLVSREALVALGRVQHRPSAKLLQLALEAELDADARQGEVEIDLRLVWALGYVQKTTSLPVLERALNHRDPAVQRLAAWALAQHRDQRGGRAVVPILEDRLASASFEVKCAIVHALGVIGDENSNLALMHAFDAIDAKSRFEVCETLDISLRPDRRDDNHTLFDPRETFAIKTLMSMGQMRATRAEIRAQVEPWLQALIDDKDNTLKTREVAISLQAGIQNAEPAPAATGP